MKLLFVFPLVFCLSPLYGQNTQAASSAVSAPTPAVHGKVETIAHCEAMIKAIDNKVAHVKSDPEQLQRAIAAGWFDRMASNRERYVTAKKALEEQNAAK